MQPLIYHNPDCGTSRRKRGIVTLCFGGGQGVALALEIT